MSLMFCCDDAMPRGVAESREVSYSNIKTKSALLPWSFFALFYFFLLSVSTDTVRRKKVEK